MTTGPRIHASTDVDTDVFATYAQHITRTAAEWNALTLSETGATVGDPAGANLAGPLTGAGVVLIHTGAGTFNIDNFEIRAVP